MESACFSLFAEVFFLFLRSAILSATMKEYEEVCTFGSDENFWKVYGANFEFRNEQLSCTIVLVVLSQIFLHPTHTFY